MPITIEIVDKSAAEDIFDKLFKYFKWVDDKFSTFKKTSEISLINKRNIQKQKMSSAMKKIFKLAEKTKKETDGYFDIYHKEKYDPSGIVKGWAIYNAAKIISKMGFNNYYIDAGGDIQVSVKNKQERTWRVGIKNPFNQTEIVKVVYLRSEGIATSGNYIRGDHIFNPKGDKQDESIVSMTVIGPNVYEADRFATAAFAMGKKGIQFVERLNNFEGYMIDKFGIATYTNGFDKYTNEL